MSPIPNFGKIGSKFWDLKEMKMEFPLEFITTEISIAIITPFSYGKERK
jgi:hypothetical protein